MAGRPRRDERVQVVVRFPPELHARLKEAAADRDLSMNWLTNRAVVEFLDHLIPADEVVLTRDPSERQEPGR